MKKKVDIQTIMVESIADFMIKKNYAPSIREIGEMVGMKSTSSVHSHLQKLINAGVIEMDPECPRTLRIPGIHYVDERNQ